MTGPPIDNDPAWDAIRDRIDRAVLVATTDGQGRAEVTRAQFLTVPQAVAMLRHMADAMEAEEAPDAH